MSLKVGELVAYMSVDDRGVAQGVDSGEKRLKGFGATATKIAAGIGTAFAVIGAVGFVRNIVTAASDLNETQSKIQNQFGASAAAIQDWAKTADSALGQSQQQALDAASSFATFGKAANLTGQDLVDFSKQSVTLSSDLASFFNVDPSQAAEAISAALRGESEPIRQFGVLLDENVIKAEAVRKGIVKASVDRNALGKAQFAAWDAQKKYNAALAKEGPNSTAAAKAALELRVANEKLADQVKGNVPELTKQQKVLATQSAIISQTSDAQGDFARTSGGLANQQRILSARFANLKATLGQQLLPVALKFATALQAVAKWGAENKGWLIPVVGVVAGLAATIYLVVKATQVWTAVQTALNIVLTANPIGAIIVAILALIGVIVWIALKTTWFQTAWNATWAAVVATGRAVGAWFAGPFVEPFVIAYHAVIGWFERMGRWFSETLPAGLATAGGVILDTVTWPFRQAWAWIDKHFIQPVSNAPAKILAGLNKGKDAVGNWFKDIINRWINVWNMLDLGIHLHIPDWVPIIGGLGFDIDDIIPDASYLARGGVIEPRRGGTPAILGEAGQQEIAAPTPLLRRIIREETGGNAVRTLTVVFEGTGILKGIRKVARVGGGDPSVVLVGGAG